MDLSQNGFTASRVLMNGAAFHFRSIQGALSSARSAIAKSFMWIFLSAAVFYFPPALSSGVPFHKGDIVVTLMSGYGYTWDNEVAHYSPDGTLLDTFDFGFSNKIIEAPGFDSSGNLYFPYQGPVSSFITIHSDGTLGVPFGSGYEYPWNILFDKSGDAFVGEDPNLPGGASPILKFDQSGKLLASYAAQSDPTSGFGVDYADLAADQCTLRYTSQGESIKQFNICTGTQLPNLVTSIPDQSSQPPFALLYGIHGLDNGDLLVGTLDDVLLVDSSGAVIKRYHVSGTTFENVALDPDKKTFWAIDSGPNNIYRFNIQTGAVVSQFNVNPLGSAGTVLSVAIVPGSGGGHSAEDLGKKCNCAGDPITLATGNEYRDEKDISLGALSFHRYYNSDSAAARANMGANWRGEFDSRIEYSGSGNGSTATVFRPDGKQFRFTLTSGQWVADADVPDRLTSEVDAAGAVTGWSYFDAGTRNQEAYNADGTLASITDANGEVTSLTYSTTSTPASVAPSAGLLLTVTDARGRKLSFSYDANGNLVTLTQPDGGVLEYAYDANGMLAKVTYPDGKSRQYVYNESALTGGNNLPTALTGDIDESGSRFTSIGYDAQGQATMSTSPGGADLTQVVYNGDGTASVTYPTGSHITLGFVTPFGQSHANSVSGPCGIDCGQPNAAATFDKNGFLASTTDFDGNVTTMTHDANGLLDQQIDGSGTPDQRTSNITWNTTLRVPLTRSLLDASGNTVADTAWVYNARGQVLARCELDPTNSAATGYTCADAGAVPVGVRRWTYTYCDAVDNAQCPIVGLLLTATGPRTDLTQVTHYSYYLDSATGGCTTPGGACHQPGDLYQVTDPLGHVTTNVSYDADGRVTRITDANGVNTDFTYTPRGWLASRSVAGATTTFAYTPYGAVQSVTDPDGVVTTFTYDAAHRLTDITDALGDHVHYTLDAAGNKTKEQIFDSAGTAHYTQSKTFNTLGELTSVVDGLNNSVFNAGSSGDYDANGNLLHSRDALGVQTQRSYDALNRLVSTIRDYNGTDASTKDSATTVAYDALNRISGVSDPDSLVTSYTYDGLGDLTHLQSPDTGLSGGATGDLFDAAGNLIQHTDARGVITQYTYDALNRITGKIYPARPTLNVTYAYDQAAPIAGCLTNDNVGHLTTMTDVSGSTAWCYTAQGDISEVQQTINNVGYLQAFAYTPGRRIATQEYPSGFTLSYTYDGDGRVATVGYLQQSGPFGRHTNTIEAPLITSVTYLPFGPMSGYTWAQGGQQLLRAYDQNYALTDISSSALNLHFLRDAKGRIAAEGNSAGASPASETYQSDALDRLTQLDDGNGVTEQAFTYNLTGDRLSKAAAGQSMLAYGYQSSTHQLITAGTASRTVDADGNTTSMLTPNGTQVQLVYDDRNLLTQVLSMKVPKNPKKHGKQKTKAIANYQYNGLGIRVWRTIKVPSKAHASTVYDPFGTGNLYGEYFARHYREYVYLNGIPVAAAVDAGRRASAISYLYADGLGTVRAATTTAGAVTDQWPWQNNAFGDKAMTGSSGYYLRFPGQYYDVETGLHYNGHRYYDPGTGRYVQSDPIGLKGGVSTFDYVESAPMNSIDPLGLKDVVVVVWGSQLYPFSVGHVFVGNMDGTTILSQFPHGPGGRSVSRGPNNTLSWQDTLAEEGRKPAAVYKVHVSDDFGFDYEVSRNGQQKTKTWYWHPHEYTDGTTNCTVAAQEALEDGGVPVPRPFDKMGNPLLTPDEFMGAMNALVANGNPNVEVLNHVPWN